MRLFRSLRSRDYRRFFTGQAVSLVGDWMTMTATGWLAYELTRDAFTLGLVVFAQQIPLLLISPIAGVLGDRVNRRKLFCVLQGGCILHSGTLAVLTLTGHLTAHLLIGLAVFRGLVNAVEFPTRQTLMVDLVGDKTNLPNAIALNSTLFNLARLAGPTFAGLAIVKLGAGWCYAVDAFSGIPVVLLMLSIRDGGAGAIARVRTSPVGALKEGIAYVSADLRLKTSLVMVGTISLAGFTGVTLAPLIARELLHGDARTLGLMHTAVGIGALGSAIFLGTRHTHKGLEKAVRFGALAAVAGQTVVAVSSHRNTTLAGMAVCGMGTVLVFAGSNTMLQAEIADDKRGRVMGLFAMCQSMYPIGGLLVGGLAASAVGPRPTLLLTAGVCLAGAIRFRKNIVRAETLARDTAPPLAGTPAPIRTAESV